MWRSVPGRGGWYVFRSGVGAAWDVGQRSRDGQNPQVSKHRTVAQVVGTHLGVGAYAAQRGRVCPGAVQPTFSTDVARRSVRISTWLGPSWGTNVFSPTVVWSSA